MDLIRPNVRLVQLTDPHLFTQADKRMRGLNTRDSFVRILDCASAFIRKADAILLTGDIAQDELGSTYEVVREFLTPLDKPVLCIPGNHDNPVEMSHRLDSKPFHYLGTYTAGNWEVVLLDSHLAGSAGGTLGEDELERLHGICTNSRAEHLLLAIHHHPVAINSQWLDTVGLADAASFRRVLSHSNKVRGVVFGHVHQARTSVQERVWYGSCPSTCSQFTPGSDDFSIDSRPPGFRWIELFQDGAIRSEVIWIND